MAGRGPTLKGPEKRHRRNASERARDGHRAVIHAVNPDAAQVTSAVRSRTGTR